MSDSTPAAPVDVETLLTLAELQARLETRAVTAGELVEGRIVAAVGETVTVEVDGTRGVVPRDEFGESPTPGTAIELYVDDPDAEPMLFSRHKAVRLALWRWLEELRRSGETVTATVISDRGGDLAVDVGGVKATLPRRELAPRRSRDTGDLLGEQLEVRVMRIREKKGQIIVSERAPVVADRAELKAQTLATLEPGQLVEGEVVRLVKFGAFVDIGGTDGLLHINDMSHRRLRHPSEVVDVGDVITVKVLRYDPDNEKISLGLKQTLPDPWTQAEERYPPGTKVTGQVVGLTKFGAFVMLPDGLEGLAHISEMAWGKQVQRPGDVVRKGQTVDAWVVRVDAAQQRLGLTLLDPADNPWLALAEKLPVGTRVQGEVARVADFGIFVNLDAEHGLDGLVHQNDFSWGPSKAPKQLFKPGDPVEVMVLGIEADRGRATLGIKQLHEDLASELIRNYSAGQTVEGRITSLQDFGAFIELEPGLEGLIPVSQLTEARVEHPEDVLQAGQTVKAAITRVDVVERKVSLTLIGEGLGAPTAPAEEAAEEAAAPAAPAEEPAAEAAAPAEEPAAEAAAPADVPAAPAEEAAAPAEEPAAPAAEAAASAEEPAAPAAEAAEDGAGHTAPYGTVPSEPPAAAAPQSDDAAAPDLAPKGQTSPFPVISDEADAAPAEAPAADAAPAEAAAPADDAPKGEPAS